MVQLLVSAWLAWAAQGFSETHFWVYQVDPGAVAVGTVVVPDCFLCGTVVLL